MSNHIDSSKIYYLKSSGFSFESKHIGASILVNDPDEVNKNNSFGEVSLDDRLNTLEGLSTSTHVVTPPDIADTGANLFAYRTTITSIKDSSTAIVAPYVKNFKIDGNDKAENYSLNYYKFAPTHVTMSYYVPDTRAVHTKKNSYINLKLKNLKTLSGQLGKVKVFYKSSGEIGEYKLLTEKKITNQNILIDTNGFDLGIFPTTISNLLNIFSTASFTYAGANIATNSSNDLQLIFGSDYAFNSAKLIASGSVLNTKENFYKVVHKKQLDFDSDTVYTITMDLVGENYDTGTDITKKPYIEVYMSGSSFAEGNGNGLQEDIKKLNKNTNQRFGKFIFRKALYGDDIPVANLSSGDYIDYRTISYKFRPNFDGTGYFVIVLRGRANWIINNVSIGTKLQPGFSPSSYNLIIPNISTKVNDRLDFKVEFYNPEEVRSTNYFETTQSILFAGNNVVIESDQNLLTGSMFIGSAIGSGIEMAGVASGFISGNRKLNPSNLVSYPFTIP